jgi:tetratricopeptide (TPR) repeat protein
METPIGLFRAHVTPIDRLVQTTVGRQEMLEDLLEKLRRNAGKKGGQHYLFIGPRGIGKTHFLTLVENAVESERPLAGLYTVIRFPEENNRILSFADILLEIVRNLGEAEGNGEWKDIHSSLSTMEEDQEIIDAAVPRLKHYQEHTGKTLLLLMENLDSLFSEQIKNEQDIHRFRTFLMDSPSATLIGTSPVYFPGLTSAQRPFYEFFDIQVLEDLSEEQTLELVRKNLELEKRGDLLDEIDNLSPKIRALHTMTGGNPRLTMMLYELIAHENILDVRTQFQKLLDQITPFYQHRMKDLAPQERALLEAMALMRTQPRTPAGIAARMRKPPQQVSSLLKRMIKGGYLTVSENPRDKRSRIYRIKEGFFDLWLAMSESRLGRKRLGYLVKFFEVYYQDRLEREKKRFELWQRIDDDVKKHPKRDNDLEFLDYLSELGDGPERFQAKLELSLHSLKEGNALKAKDLLMEVKPFASERRIFTWMTEQVMRWSESGPVPDVSQWFDGLVEYWKTQRSGDLEKAVAIAQRLGLDLSGRGLHRIRIELLQDALQCAIRPADKIRIYLQIAESESMDGQSDSALHTLKTAFDLCEESESKEEESAILNNISQVYKARGDYETALKYLEQSLEIGRDIGDKKGEATILNNMGTIAHARGDYETALKYLEQSLEIGRDIGNKAGEGATLNNIGGIHRARGDYETALKYLKQSLKIHREIGDKAGEGTTLNNISGIYHARGDYETALKYLEQSLKIRREIGDKAGEGAALNNLSQIFDSRGDYERALKYLEQSLNIRREIGDKAGEGATLNNIGAIHRACGDYETALKYLEQSIKIQREIGNKAAEGATFNNVSHIYRARGDDDTALKYLEQSLNIRREIGDKAGEATSLNNISQIYKARGNHEKAVKYLEQSMKIQREIGDRPGMISTLHNMAHIALESNDVNKALDYWYEALSISMETRNAEGIFHVAGSVGQVLAGLGEKDQAAKLLKLAAQVGRQAGFPDTDQVEEILKSLAG